MGRIGGILLVVLVIASIAMVVAYFYLGTFLERAARTAIEQLSVNLAKEGIELRDPDFNRIGIGLFPPSVAVREFSAHFAITQHNVFQIDRNFYLTIKSFGISLESLRKREFFVTLEGALIRLQPEYGALYRMPEKQDEYDRLEFTKLQIPFQLNVLDRGKAALQVRSLLKEIARLAKYGFTEMPMRMSGASAFVVREKPIKGKLLLVRHEKGFKLIMDPKDFRAIAETLGERLTDSEFDTYCTNPLRMPRLLRIRNYASDTAWKARKTDPKVPEDAYRHILWGYLLAKAYDEKFSAEVTDAHEINPVGASEYDVRTYLAEERGEKARPGGRVGVEDPAEMQMSLINNSIGREYAKRGYDENSILKRMMLDPKVVRNPSEIGKSVRAPFYQRP